MLALFERIVKSFSTTYYSEVDAYIAARNPKSAADVEKILQEYTYKQMQGWM
jgi:hypothetical protein